MSPLEAEFLTPATASSKRARTTKPILLSPCERESSAESSYDEEPAPSVKRRKTTTETSAKLTSSLPTPAKKPPTEAAITKAGKAVLEKYDAQALTAKQAADLVAYTRQLEEKAGGKKLTDSEMREQVRSLRAMIKRGIEKQLTWKASCARNAAKYSFEGMCANPAVIAAMLKVPDVTKFKQKKFTPEEFQKELIQGEVSGSARYNTLNLADVVTMRWNADTGVYKFTGSYGKV